MRDDRPKPIVVTLDGSGPVDFTALVDSAREACLARFPFLNGNFEHARDKASITVLACARDASDYCMVHIQINLTELVFRTQENGPEKVELPASAEPESKPEETGLR